MAQESYAETSSLPDKNPSILVRREPKGLPKKMEKLKDPTFACSVEPVKSLLNKTTEGGGEKKDLITAE